MNAEIIHQVLILLDELAIQRTAVLDDSRDALTKLSTDLHVVSQLALVLHLGGVVTHCGDLRVHRRDKVSLQVGSVSWIARVLLLDNLERVFQPGLNLVGALVELLTLLDKTVALGRSDRGLALTHSQLSSSRVGTAHVAHGLSILTTTLLAALDVPTEARHGTGNCSVTATIRDIGNHWSLNTGRHILIGTKRLDVSVGDLRWVLTSVLRGGNGRVSLSHIQRGDARTTRAIARGGGGVGSDRRGTIGRRRDVGQLWVLGQHVGARGS